MSGRGREQNRRGVAVGFMQIPGLDPAPETPRMRLIECRRARLKLAVDIAKNLDGHIGHERQNLAQEPAEAKVIRIIGARDNNWRAAPLPGWHRLDGRIEQGVPFFGNKRFESRRLFIVEMNQKVRQTHRVELDCEHVLEADQRRKPEAHAIAQRILAGLQIMCVEKDWTGVPLAQANRGRHAEKMVAMDEIKARRESKRGWDRRVPGDLDPHRGLIAVQPLLGRAKKATAQNVFERHAGEKARVGFKVARRGEIGARRARTLDTTGRIGDRETHNFRAEALIGARLRHENLMAATGMPCGMHDRHGSPGERQGGGRHNFAARVIPVDARTLRRMRPHFIFHTAFAKLCAR